jgi:hypothetical protein
VRRKSKRLGSNLPLGLCALTASTRFDDWNPKRDRDLRPRPVLLIPYNRQ